MQKHRIEAATASAAGAVKGGLKVLAGPGAVRKRRGRK